MRYVLEVPVIYIYAIQETSYSHVPGIILDQSIHTVMLLLQLDKNHA